MGNAIRAIPTPRTDERALWDVLFDVWGYPAVLVANRLKLFELLAEKPLTLEEVCCAKNIAKRPAETLLSVCTSLEFVRLKDGRYSLTPIAEDYLVPSSPTYFGWFFEAWVPIYSVWSPESLLKAVLTDKPQGPFGDPNSAFAFWQAEQAVNFTRAMHSGSIAAGLAWPRQLDLSNHRAMLDIGGGSGAHSIGAVSAWTTRRNSGSANHLRHCPHLHRKIRVYRSRLDTSR